MYPLRMIKILEWHDKDMMRNYMGIAILLAAIVICGLSYNTVNANNTIYHSDLKQAPKPGYAAPYFDLLGIDSKKYHVGGQREKLLLINFWASWCEPCHMEAGDLQSIYNTYQDQLELYAVNATFLDSQAGVLDFVSEHELTYPILLDKSGDVTRKDYWMDGYPTTYLINRGGVIKEVYYGVVDKLTLEKDIEKLLQE
jgi:cytochrome c biogenesis protein CcmG/thiol:disulfide interchange protein DsbE